MTVVRCDPAGCACRSETVRVVDVVRFLVDRLRDEDVGDDVDAIQGQTGALKVLQECLDSGNPPHSLDLVRFLALPYSDHPDYSEEWKP